MVELLANLGVTGSALVVTKDSVEGVIRAAHNLKRIWTLPVNQLNVQELLSRQTVVITLEAARWAEQDLAIQIPRWRDRVSKASETAGSTPEESSQASGSVATADEAPAET